MRWSEKTFCVICLNWPSNPLLNIHRCLVGDSSGKNYGDVAFLEQHNLQANILSEIFETIFTMNTHTHMQLCTGCLLFRLCHVGLQVWVPLIGQRGGRQQTLNCCVVMVAGPRCQSGRAATSESSHQTPSWHGPSSQHECTTSSWSHRSAYVTRLF